MNETAQFKNNHTKCTFGVFDSNIIDFLVHYKGIEVNKNKDTTILEERHPCNCISSLGETSF